MSLYTEQSYESPNSKYLKGLNSNSSTDAFEPDEILAIILEVDRHNSREDDVLNKYFTDWATQFKRCVEDQTSDWCPSIVQHFISITNNNLFTKTQPSYKLGGHWEDKNAYVVPRKEIGPNNYIPNWIIYALNEPEHTKFNHIPSPILTGDRWNQTSITFPNIVSNFTQPVKNRFLKELESFYILEENWDGDGANAIPEVAIDQAKKFLSEILHGHFIQPTGVAASPEGEVLIFWRNDDEYIEANFFEDGGCIVCFRSNGQMLAIEDDKVLSIQESNTFRELTKKLQEFSINYS